MTIYYDKQGLFSANTPKPMEKFFWVFYRGLQADANLADKHVITTELYYGQHSAQLKCQPTLTCWEEWTQTSPIEERSTCNMLTFPCFKRQLNDQFTVHDWNQCTLRNPVHFHNEGVLPHAVLTSLQPVYLVTQGIWGPSAYGLALVPTKETKKGLFSLKWTA